MIYAKELTGGMLIIWNAGTNMGLFDKLIKDKPPSFKSFDWNKSKAHLLLLSKYIQANHFNDFAKDDYWKNMWESLLGEPPEKAIMRFVDEGMLETTTNLNDLPSPKYKVSETKNTQKQRGLPVSGGKEETIEHPVKSDPNGIKKAIYDVLLLKCTQNGHEIAEIYLKAETEERSKVELQVKGYITKRQFKEASLAVAVYESEQLFPREIGIDWKHHNPKNDIETLNTIFKNKPKILDSIGNEKLEILRIAAAMMALWGANTVKKWIPVDFETGLSIGNDTAARMLIYTGVEWENPNRYRREGIKYVEVYPSPDSCESCRKLAGKNYKCSKAPELPNPNCTHEKGCRCTYLPSA